MSTVDSFKSSIVNFNNQWLLVETTTTKQKLQTPTKNPSVNSATTNLEISSSINCTSQDRMEILHNVILNGWLVQTISVFKPQNPTTSTQAQANASSTNQQKNSHFNIPQENNKIQNAIQTSLIESPKSTAFGSCGEEEIEEEEEDDEIIDEENQYDPEGGDDEDQEANNNHLEIEDAPQQSNSSDNDDLLYQLIRKLPLSLETSKPCYTENQNNSIKSPKKININGGSAFSRSTTNSSASSSTISKSNKANSIQMVPAFSCDNIIEDIDKKKRVKKTSILTDDSQNEVRQNFETEESIQNSNCGYSTRNSGEMQVEESIQSSAAATKDSKRSSRNNYYLQVGRNSNSFKINGEEDDHNQLQIILPPNSSLNGQTSPLRNVSSSIETALMMQLNNLNDSNNDMLQNSSCSQNEDSSNFSAETDKIYNQMIRRKRNILKKVIAKSSNNIDKPQGNISSTNLQSSTGNITTKPRKSSYLNSIKLASSPSLTNLNYKRDRKNLVKNFIKAFRGFINNPSDEAEVIAVLKHNLNDPSQVIVELNEIRKNFEKFITKKNYNNTLMVELIQNHEFTILFSHFLKEKAQEWIQTSKIKDKLSHEEALNHYLLSLKDSKALAKVRCLKYRSANNIEDIPISPMNNSKNSGEQFAFQ